ncbi:hypothetical protein R3P38DRAFT_2573169, partial [Favolaschia claudopus]
DDTFSDSDIYCRQMMRQKRGFPLYDPEPRRTLAQAYQDRGVTIGDVGRITPDGAFDFFFNVYLPADHPINNNNVPDDFYPLPPFESVDVYDQSYRSGNHVSTSSVQRLDPDLFPGGQFILECQPPQGAVLTLPHGSHVQKLENLQGLREYAAANAENWFKYINGPRGRGLNGSIYVITGCEKSPSWGLATFHSVSKPQPFELSFEPIGTATRYRWAGNPAHKKSYNMSPTLSPDWNQAPFVHGLWISLGTSIWARLFETIRVGELTDPSFQPEASGSSSSRVHGSSSTLSRIWGLFHGGTYNASYGGGTRSIVAYDFPPAHEIFHPGSWINAYIHHQVPNADVIISHDDDWQDILSEASDIFQNLE